MRHLPVRAAALVAATIVTSIPAHAQAPDSLGADSTRRAPVRLAPRRVTGSRLAPGLAAAGLRADAAPPVAHAVPGPAAIAALLEGLPGVAAFDDQGTRAQPTLVVRGFTLSPVVGVPQGVSVFLDGVRLNEADAQQVHFDMIPADAVERVELVRGPSVLFGKNTLAGALLLTTRRGDAVPRAEAALEAGPFGYRGLRAELAGVRGGWDASASARLAREDGWRDQTGARRALAFATVGRRGGAGDVALSRVGARDSLGQAGSLPGSWFRARPRANYTGGDFLAPDVLHVAARGERTLGASRATTLRGNAYVRRTRTEQFNVNVDEPSTRAFVRAVTGGGTLELAREARLGALPVALVAGVEASRGGVRYRVYREATEDAAVDPIDCAVRAGGETGLCEHARVVGDDAAAYAQATLWPAGRVAVTLAARGDRVRVPFEDLRDPDNSETSLFRRVSPRAAVRWRARESLAAYASVGTGFRAPAALELACADEASPCPLPFSLGDDPPLAPVRARTVEAGADWAWRAATLALSAYRTDVRDEIVLVQSARTAGFFRNLARTRRAGAEAQATVRGPAGTRARVSYAWLDATYRGAARLASALEDGGDARPGDRMPLTPAHRGSLALGAVRALGAATVDVELSASATSSQWLRGDEGNIARPLAGYAVAGARAAVAWRYLTATLHVANLLDRRYASFGIWGENALAPDGTPLPGGERQERFLTPGLPRTFTLSLSVAR